MVLSLFEDNFYNAAFSFILKIKNILLLKNGLLLLPFKVKLSIYESLLHFALVHIISF